MSKFDYKDSWVLINDDYVPFDKANLSIASSPVLYGLGVYTVFGANWDEKQQKLYMFRLKEHFDRLINSAKILDFHGFSEEWDFERFEKAMKNLLQKNKVQEDVLVRVCVYVDELLAGTKIHNLKNSLSAFIYPIGQLLPKEGANVCVSSWQRITDNAIPARAKVNGSYVNASLMKNEALLNGFDDAIAIDSFGHVTEGTVANLFLVKNGQLVTPDGATDILEGITRSTVFELAGSQGIRCTQRSVDRSELYTADEVFYCGSSVKITPIVSIDKRHVGSGKIGEITHSIQERYDMLLHNQLDSMSHLLTVVD